MDVSSHQLSPTSLLLFPRAHESTKERSSRNNTLTLGDPDIRQLSGQLITIHDPVSVEEITNKTIWQDLFAVLDKLPKGFVDLLVIDPPYNLNKDFNGNRFRKMADDAYEEWVDSWLAPLVHTLKPTASVYICSDWASSATYRAMAKYFHVRNRITWERDKGRGAKMNWKNCSEDIGLVLCLLITILTMRP